MTITCDSCGGNCTGEVLKVQDKHFHIQCFTCKVCSRLLASGGYFMKNNEYYCSTDYHKLYGTKCKTCGNFVEGRVVSALGNSYHPHCFTCDSCKHEIRSGTAVTYNDRQEILCQSCTESTLRERMDDLKLGGKGSSEQLSTIINVDRGDRQSQIPSDSVREEGTDMLDGLLDFSRVTDVSPAVRSRLGKCAGCNELIRSCQSLIALDKHWHLFCFNCSQCHKLLTSEYMNRGEEPFCESCYHAHYGVECDVCHQYITGKVLEAGEKHFHPSCSHCCKCRLHFNEGEDMCMAGDDVWHLDCDIARAERGLHTDTESSSEGSRSLSRSRTRSTGTTPSPTDMRSRGQRSSVQSQENKKVYPLRELQLIGSVRLPRGVERTKLEQHLSDKDFFKVFKMDRQTFENLQSWKKIDLKKRAYLF